MTQVDLQRASGIHQSTISAIETGRTKEALFTTIAHLADALAVRLGRRVRAAEIAPRSALRIARTGPRGHRPLTGCIGR